MKAYKKLEITVLTQATRARMPPFCYIEIAPTTKLNPGVCFDSCCNRTIVMISDIFLSDPTKTYLEVGDILLAINGVPVWKPEEADKEQLLAARDSKALVLYCVKMELLRDHLAANYAQRTRNVNGETRTANISKRSPSEYTIRERHCLFVAKVNSQTQLFENETDGDSRFKSQDTKRLWKKKSYESVCLPVFNNLNSLIETQLLF